MDFYFKINYERYSRDAETLLCLLIEISTEQKQRQFKMSNNLQRKYLLPPVISQSNIQVQNNIKDEGNLQYSQAQGLESRSDDNCSTHITYYILPSQRMRSRKYCIRTNGAKKHFFSRKMSVIVLPKYVIIAQLFPATATLPSSRFLWLETRR